MCMVLHHTYVLAFNTFQKITNYVNADVSLCIIPYSYVYFSSY